MSDSGMYAERMDEGPSRASLATGATAFVASYVYSVAKYGFLGPAPRLDPGGDRRNRGPDRVTISF